MTSGATTVTTASASSRPCTFPSATRPPPITRQCAPFSRRLMGYSGSSSGMSEKSIDGRDRFHHRGRSAGPPLLMEAQDLQLDSEVDLSKRHALRERRH